MSPLRLGDNVKHKRIASQIIGNHAQPRRLEQFSQRHSFIFCLGAVVPLHPDFLTRETGEALCDARRVCSFGSQHPGGGHFAMADGSIRFVKDTAAMATLRALGTSAVGEVVSADIY